MQHKLPKPYEKLVEVNITIVRKNHDEGTAICKERTWEIKIIIPESTEIDFVRDMRWWQGNYGGGGGGGDNGAAGANGTAGDNSIPDALR